MLKEKKLEFQQELEDTIEEHKIYELFEGMMKSLIVHKPEDPIDFLIKALEKTDRKYNFRGHMNALNFSNINRFTCLAKRYVIVGPPGSQSKDVSLRMIE